MERQTLTVEEAARALGIGRNTAYEAVRQGTLPVVRIGKRYLVPRAALQAMLSGAVTSAVTGGAVTGADRKEG
jgi:excisionase family DNA binding protein